MWTRKRETDERSSASASRAGRVWATGLLALALLTAACAPSVTHATFQDDTFGVGSTPNLVVESDGGRIDVIAGPPGVIVVQSSFRNPEKLEYEVTRDGDTITVAAKQQPGLRNIAKVNIPIADITITAPKSTFIDLATSNGDLEIKGMQASGKLVTSIGAITLEGVSGNFDGGTTDGEIIINSMVGNASLETANGAVSVKQGRGAFELATSNGTIYFQGELTPGGRNGFLTSNGSVVVKLSDDPSLRVLASSSNGTAKSSLTLQSGSEDQNSFSGIIGSGEAELVIQAANGIVTLE